MRFSMRNGYCVDVCAQYAEVHSRAIPPLPASGFSAPIKGYVQAGEATLCKKPYAVCDYPNGDVFVRHALQVWTCLFSCLCAVVAMMTATHRSQDL
jgi:hypothetical protein